MMLLTIVSQFCIGIYYPDCSSLKIATSCMSTFFTIFGTLTVMTLNNEKGNGQRYLRALIVLKGLKMFLAVIPAVIFAVLNRGIAIPFLIMFAVYYVIYLVLEALVLTKLNKD